MFRLYSKGCEYAIRGLMHFPHDINSNVGIDEISARARVPEHFTRKMFQVLAQKGVLTAVTGPNGGYRLARQPEQISLLEIIEVIDGIEPLNACVLGLPVCDDGSPCALHHAWSKAKKSLLPEFRRKSIADLFKSSKRDRVMRREKRKRSGHS
jgi:Rrf2 family protein